MRCPSITELPPPPPGKNGWPWDVESPPVAEGGRALPRISVVTPSFNQGHFLEETIRSVLLQGYPEIEYLIFDGGSTDNSLEIIRKYEPWLTGWVSERDRGQSDAIAKGFARATGGLIAWLNSDDLFLPGVLHMAATRWAPGQEQIIAGNVVNFHDGTDREFITHQHGITLANLVKFWEGRYRWHQPGVFFPREAYLAIGGLDVELHYAMDHDLICRFLEHGTPIVYLEQPTARFRLHGASKTCSQAPKMLEEISRVSQRYWHLLPSVDAEVHRAYMFSKLMCIGLNELVHGNISGYREIARSAYRQSGMKAWSAPFALLRFLGNRLVRGR